MEISAENKLAPYFKIIWRTSYEGKKNFFLVQAQPTSAKNYSQNYTIYRPK
jgi:hypothetical protein